MDTASTSFYINSGYQWLPEINFYLVIYSGICKCGPSRPTILNQCNFILVAQRILSLQSENLCRVCAFVYDWVRISQIPDISGPPDF